MSFFRKKFLALLLLATRAYSQDPILESKPIVEAKVGYFFFASSKMREVYDDGGWNAQLSASLPIWNLSQHCNLNAYGAVEFIRCSGHSTIENYKTYVWELPINLGLKPTFLLSQHIQYYFAVGPRYFFIRQNNSAPYVDKNKSRNGVGLFVNSGFNFIVNKHLVIDLFGEYSYAKTHFHTSKSDVYTRDVQVGGFTFGGGLGYSF